MGTAAAATASWPVPVVVVLVVAGVAALTAAVVATAPARHRADRPPAPLRWDRFQVDDLPGFAASPPGAPDGSPPGLRADGDPGRGGPTRRTRTGALLAAACGTVLLGAAALAAPGADGSISAPAAADRRAATQSIRLAPVPAAPSDGQAGAGALADTAVPVAGGGMTARLSFGGVVFEPRAVGATVTYPEISLGVTADARTALAHVRFPTFNCLSTAPPADPLAEGCVPSLDEYADLPTPALVVHRRPGGAVEFAGRFATYTRPYGSAPVYTGRIYELRVTAAPSGPSDGSRRPASGEVVLAGGRARTVPGDGLNVLRYGG